MSNETTEKPLVDKDYLLQKFPGKGGWTYAEIPEIAPDKHAWFNWVKVKGSIDNYPISAYHLMPMGNGSLFLPVKAEIRKKIGKAEGDYVHVILYLDQLPKVNSDDFYICLKEDHIAFQNFQKLSSEEQKDIVDWINSAQKDDIRVQRIARTLDKLSS